MVLGDFLNIALKDSGVLGVGQTPMAEDTNDALLRVNMMLGQWAARRWMVYHLIDTPCAMTGALFYTVGPGGAFNIARPDRLEGAYIRQFGSSPNPVDWYLEIIDAYEDYAKIALKTMTAGPSEYVFYDSGYPTGKIYPWPLPNSQYELHILTKAPLPQFTAPSDTVILPDEYSEAINYNLQVRLRAAYRLPADPVVVGLAKAAMNTIRRSNFQIARLRMPYPIWGGPSYNIFSDRGW